MQENERELNVIYVVKIDSLNPDPDNANEHPNIDIIAASLQEHGQVYPIVVAIEDNVIVKGNGTWEAAKTLGWKDIKITYTNLEKERQLSFAVADNQSGRKSYWNLTKLGNNLKKYAEWNSSPNWKCMGFSKDEVEPLISGWKSEPEPMNGGSTGEFPKDEPKPKLKSVKLSEETYELLQDCIKKLRSSKKYDTLSEEAAIEIILSEWFFGVAEVEDDNDNSRN